MDWPILNISEQRNHTVCGLLCLASFAERSDVIHPHGSLCQYLSFSWLSNIPVCLSIHPLMDLRAVSTFWLLWITLLWTSVYRFFVDMCFLLGAHLGVKSPGQMVSILRNCQWPHHLICPTCPLAVGERSNSSLSSSTLAVAPPFLWLPSAGWSGTSLGYQAALPFLSWLHCPTPWGFQCFQALQQVECIWREMRRELWEIKAC